MVEKIAKGLFVIEFSSLCLEMSLVYGSTINAMHVVRECILCTMCMFVLYCGFFEIALRLYCNAMNYCSVL